MVLFNAMVRQYDGSPDKRLSCGFAQWWRFAQENPLNTTRNSR